MQSVPSSGAGFLNAVSCAATSACTAVGYVSGSTLAERWDGTAWAMQSTTAGDYLWGVSCASTTTCTAVGRSGHLTLAEAWNGTAWSAQSTPNPGEFGNGLLGVSCLPSACTAVGDQISAAGISLTLAERWS